MRRILAPAAGVGAVVAIAACSADARDFQEQGAEFIEGDAVRERMGGVRMSGAECQEPANTEKDTLFGCTATGTDGNAWVFQIEITGSKSLRVIAGEVAGSAAPDSTDASTPASVAPDTATAPVSPAPSGSGPDESVSPDSSPAATTAPTSTTTTITTTAAPNTAPAPGPTTTAG